MLIGRMINNQFRDDTDTAFMSGGDEALDVSQGAVIRMHTAIVRDVVAVIQQRRRIEWQQPDRVDAQISDIIEAGNQAAKVADAIIIPIKE